MTALLDTETPDAFGRINIAGGWFAYGRKWAERNYKDDELPKWQRLSFYCYARAGRNGHCPAQPRELAKLLGCRSDKVKPEIDKAVNRGWLAFGSSTRCLIAPPDYEFAAGKHGRKCEAH